MSPPWKDSDDRICIYYTNCESCPCRRQACTWSHEVGGDYPDLLHGRFSKEQWEEFLAARDAAFEPVEEAERRFKMIFYPLLGFTTLSFISWFILPMLGVPIWLLMAAWALGFAATLTVACVFQCRDVESHFWETLVQEWKEQFKEAGLHLRWRCIMVGSGKRKHAVCWLEVTSKEKKKGEVASSSSSSSSEEEDEPCWLRCFKLMGSLFAILFVIFGFLYGFPFGVVMLVDVNAREHGTCFFPDSADGCPEVTNNTSPGRRLQEEQTHEFQTRERSLLTARRQLLSCEDGLTWTCTSSKYSATKSRSAYTVWEVSWPDIRFEPNDFILSPTTCTLAHPGYSEGRSPTEERCNEKGLQQSRDSAECYRYSDSQMHSTEDQCWLGVTSTGEFYTALLMLAWGIIALCLAVGFCAWRKREKLKSIAISLGIAKEPGLSTDVDEAEDEVSEASDSNDKQNPSEPSDAVVVEVEVPGSAPRSS